MPFVTRSRCSLSSNHSPGNSDPGYPAPSSTSWWVSLLCFFLCHFFIPQESPFCLPKSSKNTSLQLTFTKNIPLWTYPRKSVLILNSTVNLQDVLPCKKRTYSEFSFFVVVMLYKITESTEPLLLGEIKSEVSGNLWSRLCLNRPMEYLVLCVFLFQDILFNVYCWFINVEVTDDSTLPHN